MSRIGKEPVKLAEGVSVSIAGQKVTVKGKLGELSYTMHDGITAKEEAGKVIVECDDDKAHGNFHGLARALINSMVIGVSAGYQKQLSIEGTGFKAVLKGKELALSLGFASPKIFTVPEGITRIRSYYPAEPYKGKGIKYVGEHIRRKQGKKVA